MNATLTTNNTVSEIRAALASLNIAAPAKATKAALLALIPPMPEESPESPESTESGIASESVNPAESVAESALNTGLTRKAKAALVRKESAKHTLFVCTNESRSADLFASYRFFTAGESFAALNTDNAEFIHVDSLKLATHALYIQVSIESFARIENPLRSTSEVVRITTSPFLVPVRITYNAQRDSFELVEVLESSMMRYSKSKGFAGLDDSAIGKAIPGMTADSLRKAIVRKLRAYVANNAASVNDKEIERAGKVTLFGQFNAAREMAKTNAK